MGILAKIKTYKKALRLPDTSAFVGIIDFSYQHYALGDVLTTEIDLAIMAKEHGRKNIDLIVAVDPGKPSSILQQSFITEFNYIIHLSNIFPALLCAPMLRSLKTICDRLTFNYTLLSHRMSKIPFWPPFREHLKMDHIYPMGHKRINAFYRKRGYIPHLKAPKGYEPWAKRFVKKHLKDKVIVAINPRQSAISSVPPACINRDAPLNDWYEFVEWAGRWYPKVLFIMLGGFSEWEYRLQQYENVYIPRTSGLGLGHELALLHEADMFVGTSSGFSTYTTFTDIPYAAFNVEHFWAPYVEISVHDKHYPFAHENQILIWEKENTMSLIHHFEYLYNNLQE